MDRGATCSAGWKQAQRGMNRCILLALLVTHCVPLLIAQSNQQAPVGGALPSGADSSGLVAITVASESPNAFRITLQTEVPAQVATVYQVLTDYDHHAQILPYLSKSRILTKTVADLTVAQEGKIRILFLTFTIHVTQQVTETPPIQMRFHAIAGDFERLEGTWDLSPAGLHTHLACNFVVKPKRRVPEWAVRLAATRFLARMVQSLSDHAVAR